jgi:hypothetical protein
LTFRAGAGNVEAAGVEGARHASCDIPGDGGVGRRRLGPAPVCEFDPADLADPVGGFRPMTFPLMDLGETDEAPLSHG